MNSAKPTGFLAKYGKAMIEAGYRIVPIAHGKKFPTFDGWEKVNPDVDQLEDWLENGITFTTQEGEEKTVNVAKAGIGIIASDTPGVDIDVRDEALAAHMEEWVHEHVGMAPVRVGQAPKRLLMFRTDAPFAKLKSRTYVDDQGRKSEIEILGDGQQYVAFNIHPDTGEPFKWLYKDGPLVTPHDELPTLTVEQANAIIDEFERQAEDRGWEVKGKSADKAGSPSRNTSRSRERDVFLEDSRQTDISDEELHAKLLMVPAQPDYDSWLQVGMALFHQYNGGERGLELWHEWSEQAYPDDYDASEIDDKWERGKLSIDRKGRAPTTARLIIKLANEHAETLAVETFGRVNSEINKAKNITELKAAAAQVKNIEVDAVTREQIVGLLRERFRVLTNQVMGIKVARDMVRYENPNLLDTPRWLEDWVYMSDEDRFYNTRKRTTMTQTAFDSTFSRFMLTKQDVVEGRARPERLPSDMALNINQIPIVAGRRYMPEMDELFTIDGVRYANLYTTVGIPEVPYELSKKDRRNLEIVKAHFAHLFTIERDRELFMDWLAYIVQNPGKHPNWAVMMQGVEQDGKTFFGMMMGSVLGSSNIVVVDPKSLEAEFNGFAEGHQLAFIEEVKLHGHNRYDVLNRIKPLITNMVIPIRRMRTDPYLVPNKTAYLLATNFRDALPLNDNDSRYFLLFSRFQTRQALMAFKAENPEYYRDLYKAIEESPGAIRKWLLNREFGPEFDAYGRAPKSNAHGYMVMMAKPEEQEAIEDVLNTSMRFDLSRTLLSATDLLEELYQKGEEFVPQTRKMNKVLSDMGFTYLGRLFINGRPRRYWSMEPERFMSNNEPDTAKVRNHVALDL